MSFHKCTCAYIPPHVLGRVVKGADESGRAAARASAHQSKLSRGLRMVFADLCGQPLAANDYLTVARTYHTLVLDGVPRLNPERRDEARRFMLLIDALYEHKVNLLVAADAPPEQIYPDGDATFEFQRTVSRMQEMRTPEYLALAHIA